MFLAALRAGWVAAGPARAASGLRVPPSGLRVARPAAFGLFQRCRQFHVPGDIDPTAVVAVETDELKEIPVIHNQTLVEFLAIQHGFPAKLLFGVVTDSTYTDDGTRMMTVLDGTGQIWKKKGLQMKFYVNPSDPTGPGFTSDSVAALEARAKAKAVASEGELRRIFNESYDRPIARDSAQVLVADVATELWGNTEPENVIAAQILLRSGFQYFRSKPHANGYDCWPDREMELRQTFVDKLLAVVNTPNPDDITASLVVLAHRLHTQNKNLPNKRGVLRDQYGKVVTELTYTKILKTDFAVAMKDTVATWDPTAVAPVLDALKAYGSLTRPDCYEDLAIVFQEKIMAPLGYRGRVTDAIKLLIDLGVVSDMENHILWSYAFDLAYPAEIAHAAKAMAVMASQPPARKKSVEAPLVVLQTGELPAGMDVDAKRRVDLKQIRAYTVDDETTREVDDAISISPDRKTVYIHIADPTSVMPLGSPIELWARTQTSTLYLPEKVFPMLPDELSTGPMSILQGHVNRCLTFAIELNDDGSVAQYDIFTSRVPHVHRMSYNSVDRLLAGQHKRQRVGSKKATPAGSPAPEGTPETEDIKALYALAVKREQLRFRNGATEINIPRPEMKVVGTKITLSIDDDCGSGSRRMIKEMMIMCGEVTALYCRDHNIPVPFRSQPRPDLSQVEVDGVPDIVRNFRIVKMMHAATVNTEGSSHAALGLPLYVRASSPIRRYQDLLVHYQLKASLRNEGAPMGREMVEQLIRSNGRVENAQNRTQNKSNEMWCLQYIKVLMKKSRAPLVIRAVVLDVFVSERGEPVAQVFLDQFALRGRVNLAVGLVTGQTIKVEVVRVDPHDQFMFLRMVQ